MRRPALLLGLCLAASHAGAATLPIDGNYGDQPGCEVARTGDYNPDGIYLLTPEAINTSVSYCSFDAIRSPAAGSYDVDMTCGYEGSGPEENEKLKAEISGTASDGYTIRFEDGTTWEPLLKCK